MEAMAVRATHIIILVHSAHPPLTLGLCDNFSSILNNDLIWLECAIAADTVATIGSLDDLNADVILASSFGSFLELREAAISTLRTQPAIAIVALVKHVAVLTVLVTAGFFLAHAAGQLELLVRSPLIGSVTNKNI